MKVQIEGNLYIAGDDQNIEIRKYTGKRDSKDKELYQTIGYFGRVEQAIDKVVRMKLAESKATTLKELSADIKEIEEWIKGKFN